MHGRSDPCKRHRGHSRRMKATGCDLGAVRKVCLHAAIRAFTVEVADGARSFAATEQTLELDGVTEIQLRATHPIIAVVEGMKSAEAPQM